MSYGIAAKRRQAAIRGWAVLSMIGSFSVLVALFGYAAIHDYAPNHVHYEAAVLALCGLGVGGLFVAIFALVFGSEYL